MKLVVDQSIKIGDTQSPTVLALSNDTQRAILIPASVKRECVRALRGRWTPDATLYIRLRVTIDVEYPGHERDIKRDLLVVFTSAIGSALSGRRTLDTFSPQRRKGREEVEDKTWRSWRLGGSN